MNHTASFLPLCYSGGEPHTVGAGAFVPERKRVAAGELRFVVLLRLHYAEVLGEWNPIIYVLGEVRKRWKKKLEANGRLAFAEFDESVRRPAWQPTTVHLVDRFATLLESSKAALGSDPSDYDILHYWDNKYYEEDDQMLRKHFFQERHQCLQAFRNILADSPSHHFQGIARRLREATTTTNVPTVPPPSYEPEDQRDRPSSQQKQTHYNFSDQQKNVITAMFWHGNVTFTDLAKAMNKLSTAKPPAYSKCASDTPTTISESAIAYFVEKLPHSHPISLFWWDRLTKDDVRAMAFARAAEIFEWGMECVEYNIDLGPPKSIAELQKQVQV
ncbi:MAG: hypothetical protein Q9218_002766 [Villophora microphyllina]